MSHLFPNKPAITSEAEDPELAQLAFEATSALDAGRKAGLTMMERFKEAGKALLKARSKCKYGMWIPWLAKHKINRMTAFRAIKQASNVTPVTFDEPEIKQFSDCGEEQEKVDPNSPGLPPEIKYCSRACRLKQGPKNCKECAKLNKAGPSAPPTPTSSGVSTGPTTPPETTTTPEQPSEPPPEPMPVEEVLGLAEKYTAIAKRAKRLAKMVREIEGTEFFRRCTAGRKPEYLSDKIVNVFTTMESLKPEEKCEACDGDVQSNEDADPCPECGGKGVLTVFDKRAKEKADG